MRAVVARDTRGVTLASSERRNYFPASPVCSLIWYLDGDCELRFIDDDAAAQHPKRTITRCSLIGPYSRPTLSLNRGPMHAFVVMLMPDALALLTGLEPESLVDQCHDVAKILDPDWVGMCEAVYELDNDEDRVAMVSAFLRPRWERVRPERTWPSRMYEDWSNNLMLRAASSGWGRSLRQIERRIKRWTGRPLRELKIFSRSEMAFFEAVEASRTGSVNWSDIAQLAGFADQSHLCRETRRMTGFSPEELRRRVLTEEAFWPYRLWGCGSPHGEHGYIESEEVSMEAPLTSNDLSAPTLTSASGTLALLGEGETA